MDDFENVINGICDDLKSSKKTANNNNLGQDQAQKSIKNEFPEKQKRGCKNRGLTEKHKREYNDKKRDFKRNLRQVPQQNDFSDEIIEKLEGEIVKEDDLTAYAELYKLTCDSVLDEFKSNNTELCKKHPYMWYKNLLIELKKYVPVVTYKDIDKLYIVWDSLSYILKTIGLYITYELFQDFTKVYDYQLKKQAELNPKYNDFIQKINIDRDNALMNELAFNPYNQTNKIFIAKSHGIVEKTEPKQIDVNYNVRNYDNISNYRIQDHN
jgi:hypothetical protein